MNNYVQALEVKNRLFNNVKEQLRLRGGKVSSFFNDEREEVDLMAALASRTSKDNAEAEAKGKDLRLFIEVPLEWAEPYYFSKHICSILQDTAPGIGNWMLTRDTVPSDCGFWYFDNPLFLPSGLIGPLRAISWVVLYDRDNYQMVVVPPDGRVLDASIMRLVFWQDCDKTYLESLSAFSMFSFSPFPGTQIPWQFDTTMEQCIEKLDRNLSEENESRKEKLRYLCAAFAFLHQRLFVVNRMPIPRAVRRRLVVKHESNIQVVNLRTVETKGNLSSKDVEWNCRWMVRGHWRQQPIGSMRKDKRSVWINPYIKGPDDKPMKSQKPRIFAVVR